jgi:cellobiose phosphorylase
MNGYVTARDSGAEPRETLEILFGGLARGPSDAVFADSRRGAVAGVAGLRVRAPVMGELFAVAAFARLAGELFREGKSLLVAATPRGPTFYVHGSAGPAPLAPDESLVRAVASVLAGAESWGGRLLEDGSHAIGLTDPVPGPHFAVNLLLGNRIGYPYPLQTTPKSVVDRLGRGSFRSHAATQVLATRWDLRQEENGFPCNRQFHLVEGGAQIFYSASPGDPRVVWGECVHSQNRTVIRYRLSCGLAITRTIFLLPQEEGLPLAVEAQRIEIGNLGTARRELKLVVTGMFGPAKPGALQEDVLYSAIIMEGGLLQDGAGDILAVSPRYQPLHARDDRRFASLVAHDARGTSYPREFTLDYTAFVGSGTVERPQAVAFLGNRQSRKGPGFFALATPLTVDAGAVAQVDAFTGLVSSRGNPHYSERSLETEVSALLERYGRAEAVPRALERVVAVQEEFASFLALDTGDAAFSTFASRNLPSQVLYQTFASRSFDLTQKGYREIGFREIQDLFASMYYFDARGQSSLVRRLILDWAAQVYAFGYANHNFFWEGKEAGWWSDDALWLHQAVCRYVLLTHDSSILGERVPTADRDGRSRPLLDTLVAALRYSAEISVGPHGLPLLDRADWNDCLRIDQDVLSGPEKERLFRDTGRFSSSGTESVMNGFLAVRAARDLATLARIAEAADAASWAESTAARLSALLRKHAWIGQNYARLLVSSHPPFSHVGAPGDGLDTDESGGTLFLNSFSWAVLSGVADEKEIASMLGAIRRKLVTPHGIKLVSPSDLSRITPAAATAEYFPGDRENGAVFKHAAMMAVSALFDAAKSVSDRALARELASEAWRMVDLACPARTMADPFALAGNPRYCTQYNNGQTGENVGPLLSGTATWMVLSLMKGYGIEFVGEGLRIDPVLRERETAVRAVVRTRELAIEIEYRKPEGFARARDGGLSLQVDGATVQGNTLSLSGRTGTLRVVARFG